MVAALGDNDDVAVSEAPIFLEFGSEFRGIKIWLLLIEIEVTTAAGEVGGVVESRPRAFLYGAGHNNDTEVDAAMG